MSAAPDGDRESAADDAVDPSFGDPLRRFLAPRSHDVLTRFFLLRLLGLVYLVAFLVAARQLVPLVGHDGITPAALFLERARAAGYGFLRLPTLFWAIAPTDAHLLVVSWIGVGLSAAVLFGLTNAIVQFVLWALYLSIVHVGQRWYGYGWESQLCETGFLAIFLCPIRSAGPLPDAPPPRATIVLFRWLVARVMLGAGLIKWRGDPCWRDLTCLVYHFETQPIPSPASWLLHNAPRWVHEIGVVVNHGVELVAPFFAFGPRRARHVAGAAFVGFQLFLIVSGNLSFLNWLTIVPAIACFDDALLGRLVPRRLRERAAAIAAREPRKAHRVTSWVLAFAIGVLSVGPVANLLSPHQVMNTSFEPFELVNTYGAFGSVSRERIEVVLEGTTDAAIGPDTPWREYELPCQPGDVRRRPCLITPYHERFDWQMWFAGLSSLDQEPWLARVTWQLLHGDRAVLPLFARNPFPDAPPHFIRALRYRYRFTRFGEGDGYWRRELLGTYMRPVSLEDPALARFLDAHGLVH